MENKLVNPSQKVSMDSQEEKMLSIFQVEELEQRFEMTPWVSEVRVNASYTFNNGGTISGGVSIPIR